MAITVYTRTLPNLLPATRRATYRRLILLLDHIEGFGIDLIGFSIDIPTRVVTITLTDPIPADNVAHLDLGP